MDKTLFKLFTYGSLCVIIVLLASYERVTFGAASVSLVFGTIAATFGLVFIITDAVNYINRRK
jgi:hypothetical protein